MSQQPGEVTGAAIKQAIETRNAGMLSGFYADDAVLRIIDRNHPPSRPQVVSGREAIGTYWNDVCGRAMTHDVAQSVADGNALAFSETCTYPDGVKVACLAMIELERGKIARQTVVQAWDE